MATEAEARAALRRISEQAEASRSKNGTIAEINGRHVQVILDGDGSGIVIAHRGVFEPVIGSRVKVTRVAGTNFWKIMGVADDALIANDGLPYDLERQGESLYYPLPLEAINNGSYNFGTNLDLTVYNFQVMNSENEFVYTASQTLDMSGSVPASNSRWAVVYGDASSGTLAVYNHPSTATPDDEWPDAVNGLLGSVAGAIPVLAVRMDAGMTSWPSAWRALKRGYNYGNKRVIRIPAPVQPTAGTVITDAYYQTIENNGTPVTSRPKLNFIGTGTTTITVTDNGSDATDVEIDSTGLVKDNFTELDDTPSDYSTHGGKFVRVNATEDGLEFSTPPSVVDDFTDLSDVPATYMGHANKLVSVKNDETGLEFTNNHAVFEDFGIAGDTGTGTITDGETLQVLGSGGIDTAVSGNAITISLDINELTEEPAIAAGDFIPFYDATAGAIRKVDFDDLPSGGGGATDFTDLGDVPAAYTGHGEKLVAVKADETGLEFIDSPTGSGVGAPDNAFYVTGVASAGLSDEIVIPGLRGSADIAGAAGSGFSEEYDTGTTGLTWSPSAPATVDSNTTILSHLYVHSTDTTERFGLRAWSPSGAFDVRCKIEVSNDFAGVTDGSAMFMIADAANTSRVLVGIGRFGGGNSFNVYAYTYASGSYSQRGGVWTIGSNVTYLRITRDVSNNVTFWWSATGHLWQFIATESFTFTPAQVGYRMAATNPNYAFASDWLRADV